jgi:hypothetical protein
MNTRRKKHLALGSVFVLFFFVHKNSVEENNTANSRKNTNRRKQNGISSSPWRKSWETAQDVSACASFSPAPLEGAADRYRSRAPAPTYWSTNNQPLVSKPSNKLE